jgi:tetratricopeptide (TPR) repeat protein
VIAKRISAIAALTAALLAALPLGSVAGKSQSGRDDLAESLKSQNRVDGKSIVSASTSVKSLSNSSPKNNTLRKINDALIGFRSDEALRLLVPLINKQAKRGFSKASDRLLMARLLSLAGFAFYIDENLFAGIHMYSLAHRLCPDDISAKCGLANGLREKPDFDAEGKLIGELEKLPESDKNILVYVTVARHYKRVGEYGKAIENLRKAEALDVTKSDVNSQVLFARTLIVSGYGKQAAERFKLGAARTENKYMREIFLANAALVELKDSAQEAHLLAAGKIYADDPIWRVKLAEYYFGHDREQEGFDQLQQALLSKRLCGTAYMKMARHLWVKKRFAEAEQTVKMYQKRARVSSESLAMLAEIADARSQREECEKRYQSTLAQDPFYAGAYENLAKHFIYKVSEPERALAVTATFVAKMPRYWPAHFIRARAMLANDDVKGATKEAQAGLALLPESAAELNPYSSHEAGHAHAIIGTSFYIDKKYDEALVEAKVFNKMKFNPDLPVYLKVIIMRPGKLDFGGDDADEVVTHTVLADMLLETNRLDDSISEYRKALKINPDDSRVRAYLLHVLSQKGDWGEAAKENMVYSQQVVNKIPATIDEWTNGKKKPATAPRGAEPGVGGSIDAETGDAKRFDAQPDR